MLVVNIRHSLLLTDYNGKRYAFYPGKPVEISPEVYNSIVQSKHINADDIRPYVIPNGIGNIEAVVDKNDEIKDINTEKVIELKRGPGRPRRK